MKKIAIAAVLSLGGLASAVQAGGCDSPYCQGKRFGGGFGGKSPMPAFQAAPWYLYWPYNQHFMTPAPLQGAYSAPPMGYGGLVNPYFPAGGTGYPSPAPSSTIPPAAMPSAPIPSTTPGTVSIPAVPSVIVPTSARR